MVQKKTNQTSNMHLWGVIALLVVAVLVGFYYTQQTGGAGSDDLVKQPSSDNTVVEDGEVTIRSQIVRPMEALCGYYFLIRNNMATQFSGRVEIALFTEEEQLGSEVFSTKGKPLRSTEGLQIHLDLESCEPRAEEYTYTVFSGENILFEGRTTVSEKTYQKQ